MAIITISRGIQSGGRKLAGQLAERLGYSCLSREVVTACAQKYNITEKDLYHRLLDAPNWWHKLTKEHTRYLAYIQSSLVDAAKQDNIIYHGYAGQLFLKDVDHALKIRLETPLADRVEAEKREFNKSHEEAVEHIKNMDDQRSRWIKYLYGEEWHDASLYDLSINLVRISEDIACALIESVVRSDRYQTTESSQRKLNDHSIACAVKAAIVTDDHLWNQKIFVDAFDSVVTLRGTVEKEKTRDAIADIAAKVEGVTGCVVHISLFRELVPNH